MESCQIKQQFWVYLPVPTSSPWLALVVLGEPSVFHLQKSRRDFLSAKLHHFAPRLLRFAPDLSHEKNSCATQDFCHQQYQQAYLQYSVLPLKDTAIVTISPVLPKKYPINWCISIDILFYYHISSITISSIVMGIKPPSITFHLPPSVLFASDRSQLPSSLPFRFG